MTTYTLGEPGPLATATIAGLRRFFEQETRHRPSQAMFDGMLDVAIALEAQADGLCPRAVYLSSLDPGVGKTQTVAHFLPALLSSESHGHVGIIICVSRLDEIDTYVAQVNLDPRLFCVITSDKERNSRGSADPSSARVVFTTQQMVERKCAHSAFADVDAFRFEGKPRQVRIWDESILPASTLTVSRYAIAGLLQRLAIPFPAFTEDLDKLVRDLGDARDGDIVELPPLDVNHEIDVNEALAALKMDLSLHADVSALWLLFGRRVTIRQDGRKGNTLLDYRETLPRDLLPIVVLDASGRVRQTYEKWRLGRGNLVRLLEAPKSYSQLRIHLWKRGGGRTTITAEAEEIAEGIAATIKLKPTEEWLVVYHKPKGRFHLEREVASRLGGQRPNVSFITWGNHHATNRYGHIPNVILAGTLFMLPSHYESLARGASGFPSSSGRYPANDLADVVQGEHAHGILQAACRGTVRQCEGSTCRECDLYIIASQYTRIPELLPSIFPDCHISAWHPIQRQPRATVKKALDLVGAWAAKAELGETLPFSKLQKMLGIKSASNFRRDVRSNQDFVEGLEDLHVMESYGKKYPTMFVRVTSEEIDLCTKAAIPSSDRPHDEAANQRDTAS